MATVRCLDTDNAAWNPLPVDNLCVEMESAAPAYVIFTSGSTGQPKGVINSHRGIVNRLLWMQDEYQIGATDVVVQKTPYTFDVSVWEVFWPLLFGSRLQVAVPGGHRDNSYLFNLTNTAAVTTIYFVPLMLQMFLQDPSVTSCQSLKRVISSGEARSGELQELFFQTLPDAELQNLYGPTEAVVRGCRAGTSVRLPDPAQPAASGCTETPRLEHWGTSAADSHGVCGHCPTVPQAGLAARRPALWKLSHL